MAQNKLVDWVMGNIEEWRSHRDDNFLSDWSLRDYGEVNGLLKIV